MSYKETFRISGSVINRRGRARLAGLRVEAWDSDLVVPDLVGSALTDEEGAFRIEFGRSYFRELFGDRRPDLFFRVFRGDELVASTEESVLWNVEAGETEVVIEVDLPAEAEGGVESDNGGDGRVGGDGQRRFVVRGRVARGDGGAVPRATVRAFDRDLRAEQLLGEARADEDGRYEIAYGVGQFRRAEKGSADLVVRAYEPGGDGGLLLLAASPVIFNAGWDETVELVAEGVSGEGPSEYERLTGLLAPVLEGASLAGLNDEEVAFLAGETGLGARRLQLLITSARNAERTGLPPELFYGLARQNLPARLAELLALRPEVWRAALEAAEEGGIVPAWPAARRDEVLEGLRGAAARLAFEKLEEPGAHSAGELLGLAIAEPGKAREFVERFTRHEGTAEEFWAGLRDDPRFADGGLVDRLRLTLQLGALTRNNVPLVGALQGRGVKEARDLAALDEGDWLSLVGDASRRGGFDFPPEVPGADEGEKAANYAKLLNAVVEETFPTAVIAHRITREPQRGKEHLQGDLVKFFSEARDFDFADADVDAYLTAKSAQTSVGSDASPEAAGFEDAEGLAAHLKAVQRVFKIAPRYAELKPLLDAGLDSAHAVVRAGKEAFVRDYGERVGGEAQAAAAYERASQAAAVSEMVLARYGSDLVLGTNVTSRPPGGAGAVADIATLFGSLSMCECQHCRSVYSPAAYLVDVLAFLKNRPARERGMSALDVMLERRPDIEHIELSCPNTTTELPYIDLVNEVLERAVSRRPGAPAPDPEQMPQTRGTTEALKAYPEHLDPAAYEILSREVYPQGLPFDFPLEEARAFLTLLGTSRGELLQTFGGGDRRAEFDLACEDLGLSPAEGLIVTAQPLTPPRELREFYGYALERVSRVDPNDSGRIVDRRWTEWLARVPEFLERTGLSFEELLQLFETRHLRRGREASRRVALSPDSDRCDLARMTIINLDADALGRIHRFVRLWRKTGWAMREFDAAVEALGRGEIDAAVVEGIAHAKRLMAELKLPLGQLLTLWADIGTQGEGSLYETLFQNRALLNPPDAALRLAAPDGAELAIFRASPAEARISRYLPAVLAALQAGESDLAALISAGAADDVLNLSNLSALYRHVLLARALRLTIKDFLALNTLLGGGPANYPFEPRRPASTAAFIERVRRVRAASYTADKLSYLYRPGQEPPASVTPTDGELSVLFEAVQGGLRQIAAETEPPVAPTEEELRAGLAELLDEESVATAVGLMGDARVYAAPLASAPPASPPPLAEKISYDAAARELRFAGEMTEAERAALLSLPAGDGAYRAAVEDLFGQPRRAPRPVYTEPLATLPRAAAVWPAALAGRVSYSTAERRLSFAGNMTAGERTSLEALSDEAEWRRAVGALFARPRALVSALFGGFLDAAAATRTLLDTPTRTRTQAYAYVLRPALTQVRAARGRRLVEGLIGDSFKLSGGLTRLLTGRLLRARRGSAAELIDGLLSTEGDGLSATYFRDTELKEPTFARLEPGVEWGARPPARWLGDTRFGARWSGKVLAQSDETYTFYVRAAGRVRLWVGGQLVINGWGEPSSSERSGTLGLRAGRFYDLRLEYAREAGPAPGGLYVALEWGGASTPRSPIPPERLYSLKPYDLLRKASLLVKDFGLTEGELTYMSAHGERFAGFDLNALDVRDAGAAGARLFDQWEILYELSALRGRLLPGARDLAPVFEAETLTAALGALARAADWDGAETAALAGREGFNFGSDDHRDVKKLSRLGAAFELGERVGVPATRLSAWARRTQESAPSIRGAVKGRHDEAGWLAVAAPVADTLRERRRAALVAYLTSHPPHTGGRRLRDADELYGHFLIDVEMSACQATSRVKQAIGSAQTFVQRCLMGLEEVAFTPEDARQWEWMKNYRVWEVNRKIFLYPENWVEEELRDDKSPFFKDFENALLQSDITPENAEAALQGYLEKLDEVSNLEVCGMYHQYERNTRGEVTTDLLHVFARTRGRPHVYYHRRLVEGSYWTAWERVDLDIEGDHLLPVVYERRLYLIWPLFRRRSRQPDARATGEPPAYWEVRIAWSEYRGRRWSEKKESGERDFVEIDAAEFRGGAAHAGPQHLFFNAVVNGDRLDVNGYLYADLEPDYGTAYVTPILRFTFTGCRGRVTAERFYGDSRGNWVQIPASFVCDSRPEFMSLVEISDRNYPLRLSLLATRNPATNPPDVVNLLGRTPGTFRVRYPHQFIPRIFPAPFFYQDDTRSFFVSPAPTEHIAAGKAGEWGKEPAAQATVDAGGVGVLDAIGQYAFNVAWASGSGSSVTVGGQTPQQAGGSGQPEQAAYKRQLLNPRRLINTRVMIEEEGVRAASAAVPPYRASRHFLFEPFYHPYVCLFIKELRQHGVDGLLRRAVQVVPDAFSSPPLPFDTFFEDEYVPNGERTGSDARYANVLRPYPVEDVDFRFRGAYALYNWELFFHAPLLVASRLSQNQRFEEAQRWFHYIFNPADASAYNPPGKFWKVRPFFEEAAGLPIHQLLTLLHYRGSDPYLVHEREGLEAQVRQWRHKPFNPHLIARMRVTAYQKATVMKYLDNLIAWGDQLFRRDTIESINEATQLYVLAAEILGPRPEKVPPRDPGVRTFRQLRGLLDDFSNAAVAFENTLPPARPGPPGAGDGAAAPTPMLTPTFYFCIPRNEKLLKYWDTVADRLFKIRHCMNIEGVVRALDLFEPEIDPALLVRAAAAGAGPGAVLGELSAPLPRQRFAAILQKAVELCADVRGLGSALLAALEKRDAEALSLLRSRQEMNMLAAVRLVKQKQLEEAGASVEALNKGLEVTRGRREYYRALATSYMNAREQAHLSQLEAAAILGAVAQGFDLASSIAHIIPDFDAGATGFLPTAKTKFGGSNVGAALQGFGRYISMLAGLTTHSATKASILGGYDRRQAEWQHQFAQAEKEFDQVTQQIAAAALRVRIAERELSNHDLQAANVRALDDYMREKFTSRELYDWMVSRLSALYFQSYQLAYDLAKRAERAFRFELGKLGAADAAAYVRFGQWDSLRGGLLAGEQLHYDLRRMEAAYLEENRREYELTKHVSLVIHDPLALISLRETGRCHVTLPESLFDADYPGHYMRRIKSVTLTIPAVTGPYTSVNCTLTLLRSKIRAEAVVRGDYADEANFVAGLGAARSIATSHGQNDGGLFELSFRDERYLPFEGLGAVSEWRIELPQDSNAFDFATISDVVINLSYTAREGGGQLRQRARRAAPAAAGEPLLRMFSAKHEFATEWFRFLQPAAPADSRVLRFELTQDRFPFQTRGRVIELVRADVFVHLKEGVLYPPASLTALLGPATAPGATPPAPQLFVSDPALGGLPHAELRPAAPSGWRVMPGANPWSLTISSAAPGSTTAFRLSRENVEDVTIICHYVTTAA